MKILIFSDLHLDTSFDQRKYDLLYRLITESDQVILNGDFWEGLLISFDRFVNSKWQPLFALLKSKNTLYLYGNHDKKRFSTTAVNLFSTQQQTAHTIVFPNYTLYLEHGDKFVLFHKKYPFLNMFPTFLIVKVFNFIELVYVWIFGVDALQEMYRKFNTDIKNDWQKIKKNDNHLIITGHTHSLEVDLSQQFINTGFVRHGIAQYIMITDGVLELRQEWYDAEKTPVILAHIDLR